MRPTMTPSAQINWELNDDALPDAEEGVTTTVEERKWYHDVQTLFPEGEVMKVADLATFMNSIGSAYRSTEVEVEMSYMPSPTTVVAVWSKLDQTGWGPSTSVGEYNVYDLLDLRVGQVGQILTCSGRWALVQQLADDVDGDVDGDVLCYHGLAD
jgi:hypothetical protein